MMLALAAQQTATIGFGPGVLVPALRHPMVNASATAALTALAPGRVAVCIMRIRLPRQVTVAPSSSARNATP